MDAQPSTPRLLLWTEASQIIFSTFNQLELNCEDMPATRARGRTDLEMVASQATAPTLGQQGSPYGRRRVDPSEPLENWYKDQLLQTARLSITSLGTPKRRLSSKPFVIFSQLIASATTTTAWRSTATTAWCSTTTTAACNRTPAKWWTSGR